MTRIYLSWADVDQLIDEIIAQFAVREYDIIIAITRGGIIPGGIIGARLGVEQIMVASVDFYEADELDWPVFMQFPADSFLRGKRVLVVDDLWDRGKQIKSVLERVQLAGGRPDSVALHYKPHRSLFKDQKPTYFGVETEDWIIYPWEVDRNPFGVTNPPLGVF